MCLTGAFPRPGRAADGWRHTTFCTRPAGTPARTGFAGAGKRAFAGRRAGHQPVLSAGMAALSGTAAPAGAVAFDRRFAHVPLPGGLCVLFHRSGNAFRCVCTGRSGSVPLFERGVRPSGGVHAGRVPAQICPAVLLLFVYRFMKRARSLRGPGFGFTSIFPECSA